MDMKQDDLLINRLIQYGNTDMYPFHMPGHKRSPEMEFPNPYTVDITEIDGFDNLHHPEGILKESMEWAAGQYGADRTYYLVNGSSCGILSAVCGAVPRGGRILVSRNCHKSVYHGIYLSQLKASYIYPQEAAGLGIQGGILPSDVDMMLKRYMDTQAVIIVSPTYDGVVSDIRGIARVVHGAGLPLIVDEAHGAHFRYGEMFPVSALDSGADVVVQSVHKTMPSLTQTALLHIRNNRPDGGCYADRDRIDRYVHMMQSSSPSYVFMAGIENSIFQMEHMDMTAYGQGLHKLRKRLGEMKHLRLVDTDLKGKYGIFDLDLSKIVISVRGLVWKEYAEAESGAAGWAGDGLLKGTGRNPAVFTGADLEDILRREYHLEVEMCGADYVTAITTVMDRPEGLDRLGDALMGIDGRLEWKTVNPQSITHPTINVYSMRSDTAMTIADAMEGTMRPAELKDSAGCISGEFVYIYPPGIPIIAPGEWISKKALDVVLDYIDKKLPVQGPEDSSLRYIRTVLKD